MRATAEEMRAELGAPPTLALAFVTTDYSAHLADFQEVITVHGHTPLVVGCTGSGLIGTGREEESQSGFSLIFLHLPQAEVRAIPLWQSQMEEGKPWREIGGPAARNWLAFANPFVFDSDTWLQGWSAAYGHVPCVGGLASGPRGEAGVTVFGPGIGQTPDALAVAIDGARIEAVVSQGCRPIGEALPITRVDEHLLLELGSRPAYEVLEQAFHSLHDAEKQRARGNLFAGLAIDEYKDAFGRGDFLVRNILGADPATGAVVVGAHPRAGQTVQYQLRDAESAGEDFRALLEPFARDAGKPAASLLFCCNGRGKQLFNRPDHDASILAEKIGNLPSSGFFCNGEIGPIGGRNFLHGYAALAALVY